MYVTILVLIWKLQKDFKTLNNTIPDYSSQIQVLVVLFHKNEEELGSTIHNRHNPHSP